MFSLNLDSHEVVTLNSKRWEATRPDSNPVHSLCARELFCFKKLITQKRVRNLKSAKNLIPGKSMVLAPLVRVSCSGENYIGLTFYEDSPKYIQVALNVMSLSQVQQTVGYVGWYKAELLSQSGSDNLISKFRIFPRNRSLAHCLIHQHFLYKLSSKVKDSCLK